MQEDVAFMATPVFGFPPLGERHRVAHGAESINPVLHYSSRAMGSEMFGVLVAYVARSKAFCPPLPALQSATHENVV